MMVIGYDQLPEQLLHGAHLMHVPVDLTALTAHLGIQLVSRSDVPAKVGGFLYRGPLWDVIVVNALHPAVRRRFTIAHEIGHWALDGTGLFFKGDHSGDELEIEHAMDAFAATLLMPDELVKAEVQRFPSVAVLAKTFYVSPAAMKRRLSDLDLVLLDPDPDFDSCFISSSDDLPRDYY